MSANVPPPVALNKEHSPPHAEAPAPSAPCESALPLRRPVRRKRQRPRIVVPPFDFVPPSNIPSLPTSFYPPQQCVDDSETRVGLWKNHRSSACASRRGSRRMHNEDRVFYDHDNRIYGVCDGHGAGAVPHAPREQLAADTVQQLLPSMVLRMPVGDAFDELDRIVLAKLDDTSVVGTTVAMVRVFDESRVLQVAHVGDSRVVLIDADGHARTMTNDHTPTRHDEATRIERDGGYVLKGRVNDILSVSRAIGDKLLKYVVPPTADVSNVALRSDDQLVLIATDGLWDVATAAEVARLCCDGGGARVDLQEAARTVVAEAARRGSRDDVTVVLLDVRF